MPFQSALAAAGTRRDREVDKRLADAPATWEEYSGGTDQCGKQALRRDCGCDAQRNCLRLIFASGSGGKQQ